MIQLSDAPTMGSLKHYGFRRKDNHPDFKYLTRYANPEGVIYWRARIPATLIGHPWSIILKDDRDAALRVDKELIRCGRQPVNILKRK